MTPLAWFLAGLGLLACVGAAALIVRDVYLELAGRETISRHLLEIGLAQPWVPAVVTGIVCLIVGALVGHFWFPQER